MSAPAETRIQARLPADVGAQADGHTRGDHLDDAAGVSPSFLAASISRDHRRLGRLAERPHGTRRSRAGRRCPAAAVVGIARADRDDVRHDLDTGDLAQEAACDRARGDTGGGLARTGPFQDRASVVEPVLQHAGVVGMAEPRRVSIASAGLQLCGIHGIGAITCSHFGPLAVADLDGDRAAQGDAVAQSANTVTSSASNFIRAPRP